MRLNTLSPSKGSKKASTRVGRGIGSGFGKTCGRGHKGQKSRSGGFHKIGFEGGQTPLQRRLPKIGFRSRTNLKTTELRLDVLNFLSEDVCTIEHLILQKKVKSFINKVRIINSGKLEKKINLKGIYVTSGAKKAIESLGGTVEG